MLRILRTKILFTYRADKKPASPTAHKQKIGETLTNPLNHFTTPFGEAKQTNRGKKKIPLLNAGIKLPTRNVPDMVTVSASCAKINGRNCGNNICAVGL